MSAAVLVTGGVRTDDGGESSRGDGNGRETERELEEPAVEVTGSSTRGPLEAEVAAAADLQGK